MEDGVSSSCLGWLDVPWAPSKTGRRGGGSPRCASSALYMSGEDLLRGLPLPAAPTPADLFGHRPALGDDGLGLLGSDGGAVGVADDIGHAAVEDRPGALGQVGGDHADRAVVVFAALDHLEVVEAGQLGGGPGGGVGGAEQGGPEQAGGGRGGGGGRWGRCRRSRRRGGPGQ